MAAYPRGRTLHFRLPTAILGVLLLAACGDPATAPEGDRAARSAPEPGSAALSTSGTSAVLVGAGDIASCSRSGDAATARLLDSIPGTVFTAGDNAYPDGTLNQFKYCYGPTWGRHKSRTRPSVGNADYRTAGAAGYFEYFGAAAGSEGSGYYSYDLGSWHIIVLNSEIDTSAGSPQVQWLERDLAAHPTLCTLAYWHKPRFSSGGHGSSTAVKPFWDALYQFGAEVVISGHDHDYERFAPMTPDGRWDVTNGIRQFVVGTGGNGLSSFSTIRPNSQVRYNRTTGVLELTLQSTGYSWKYIPTSGSFTDTGSKSCH